MVFEDLTRDVYCIIPNRINADVIFSLAILNNCFENVSTIKVENIPSVIPADTICFGFDKKPLGNIASQYEQIGKFKVIFPNSVSRIFWIKYGRKYLKSLESEYIDYLWNFIDQKLFYEIDLHMTNPKKMSTWTYRSKLKCRISPHTIPELVVYYNSVAESINLEENFSEAINFAQIVFDRLITLGILQYHSEHI